MRKRHASEAATEVRNKRQQILDAAGVVFARKGYHKATVDEIIALADTGKGTVYNYFVNKEQLFYTLIQERSASFEQNSEAILSSGEPPLQKIHTLIREFLAFFVVNADLCRVMMHELRGLGAPELAAVPQQTMEKYNQWFCRNIGRLEAVISQGIEAGALRNCETRIVGCGIFSVIVMMVFQGFVKDNIDEMATSINDIVLYGVVASS
nr:TetR/AcrR family transcriptional regulator [uncultured Anaeromusa sp.]